MDPNLKDYVRNFLPSGLKNFLTDSDLDTFLSDRIDFLKERPEEIKLTVMDPPESQPWLVNATIVEALLPDSPFIVDTLMDYFKSRGIRIHQSVQYIIAAERDEKGNLNHFGRPDDTQYPKEACNYIEIESLDEDKKETVRTELLRNLTELRTIVSDFGLSLTRIRSLDIQKPGPAEDLQWIIENFVVFGSVFYDNKISEPLGLFKHKRFADRAESELRQISQADRQDHTIVYLESSIESNVNRHRPVHFILIRNRSDTVILAGTYAARGEMNPRFLTPPIRRRIEKLAKKINALTNSHRTKTLFQIAQLIPIGILLSRKEELLESWLLTAQENLYSAEAEYRIDLDKRHKMIWLLAMLPVEDRIEFPGQALTDLAAELNLRLYSDVRRRLYRHDFRLLALVPDHEEDLIPVYNELENSGEKLFSTWISQLKKLIRNRFSGRAKIDDKLRIYTAAVAREYEQHESPAEALSDLILLESEIEDSVKVRYYSGKEFDTIKVFTNEQLVLSEAVPVLSNFGFRILAEYTFPAKFPDRTKYVQSYKTDPQNLTEQQYHRIAGSIAAVYAGAHSSVSLNAIVRYAPFTAKQLFLLKALTSYLYQIDSTYGRASISETLLHHPSLAHYLILMFEARFHITEDTQQNSDELETRVNDELLNVQSSRNDRILRGLRKIIQSAIRTNYRYFDPAERSELIIKFDAEKLELPGMQPVSEIFIYSVNIEGVHLRAGSVARGGIRWSDRYDDYRTEVLGLMRAQVTKNTVIVPTGSKGGFIIRSSELSGEEGYRKYIKSLLAVTDTKTPDGIKKPQKADILDGDDPYLVVAADKGTATFSDTANEISKETGFWLKDAFASGGSNGYDHKKQGITAKGAWVSVRRHFAETGTDPEKDPVTVTGIGDPSGDVFGNGSLLSSSMKLIAAFNHKHIFIDPDPDPRISFEERKRLFEIKGGWDQYNTELISEGGGVFQRSAARIGISAQVKKALATEEDVLSGERLIQEILKAPVDLLFNGGIGTYVKSSHESQTDAKDPSNDPVRINGNEVRAKVIGEGGNLGLTQKGRIEAALNSVRLNTDSIDNSAGVDMSDHEVNLKILLDTAGLEDAQRTQWIRRIEEEQIRLVLGHNFYNNLALSVEQKRHSSRLQSVHRMLNEMHIPVEPFPETMTRPYLSSFSGLVRLALRKEIQNDPAFDDGFYSPFLHEYFPAELNAEFKAEISKHPLASEIIRAMVVNRITWNGGLDLIENYKTRAGLSAGQTIDLYMRIDRFIGAESLRAKALESKSTDQCYDELIRIDSLIRSCMDHYLYYNSAQTRTPVPESSLREAEELQQIQYNFWVYLRKPQAEDKDFKNYTYLYNQIRLVTRTDDIMKILSSTPSVAAAYRLGELLDRISSGLFTKITENKIEADGTVTEEVARQVSALETGSDAIAVFEILSNIEEYLAVTFSSL